MDLLSTLARGLDAFIPGAGTVASLALDYNADRRSEKTARAQFERNTLTGRVNEARRLGLSPLAVLGAPTSSPTVIAGQSRLGSGLKDAIAAAREPKPDQEKQRLERKLLNAEIFRTEAEGMAALSMAAKDSQPGNPLPTPQPGCSPDEPLYVRRWDPIAKETVWHPNLNCWPELGEAAGAAAVVKSKTAGAGTSRLPPPKGFKRSSRGTRPIR